MLIQHQTGERDMTASRTFKWQSSFNSNPKQFRWLEERDKVSYMHLYLQAESPVKLSNYNSRKDQLHQQLDAYDPIKIDSRLINSNLGVQRYCFCGKLLGV